jgi:hypothetical protein
LRDEEQEKGRYHNITFVTLLVGYVAKQDAEKEEHKRGNHNNDGGCLEFKVELLLGHFAYVLHERLYVDLLEECEKCNEPEVRLESLNDIDEGDSALSLTLLS